MTLFTGLSAFPLTPLADDSIDESAFARLVRRLATAGVDSITALGSTGCAPYLTTAERARVARVAVENAEGTPLFIGVSDLRTSQVLTHADAAEDAGAQGLLLAPMTYQPLTDDDVFELYRAVSEHTRLPVIVYDNPGTTHFSFSIDLYARIAALPGVASIKIPGVPVDPAKARDRIDSIRDVIPADVTIGVSGDAFGSAGLIAGCDAWYSVLGGTMPELVLPIVRAAQNGRLDEAKAGSARLDPLWRLYAEFGGSLRVIAAIAEHLGLAPERCLPRPIQGLDLGDRARVHAVMDELGLA